MKLTISFDFAELLLYLNLCHNLLLCDLTLPQYYKFLIKTYQIFI